MNIKRTMGQRWSIEMSKLFIFIFDFALKCESGVLFLKYFQNSPRDKAIMPGAHG